MEGNREDNKYVVYWLLVIIFVAIFVGVWVLSMKHGVDKINVEMGSGNQKNMQAPADVEKSFRDGAKALDATNATDSTVTAPAPSIDDVVKQTAEDIKKLQEENKNK